MPGLPELEVLRRDLEKEIVGRRVKDVEVRAGSGAMNAIRRHGRRKDFSDLVRDAKLETVGRYGRKIAFDLDNSHVLVVDLGPSGKLLKTSASEELESHTHVVLTFTIGGQLRFVDAERKGEIFVVDHKGLEEIEGVRDHEIDPLDGNNPLAWQHFSRLLDSKAEPMKKLLMDESFIVGLGDMYSDEVLFAAGLRYDHPSNFLSSQDVRRLYRSLMEILMDAIKARGTSMGEDAFVDLSGKPGEYQEEIKVFEREGESCRRCRNTIVKEEFGGTYTYFCPQCQS